MSASFLVSRRNFLSVTGIGALASLAGCASTGVTAMNAPLVAPFMAPPVMPVVIPPESPPDPALIYAAVEDNGFLLPAIPYKKIDPKFYRQQVVDPTGEPAGTIVVDTPNRFLYMVEKGGTAMRYGVSIGKDGFAWQGEGVIQWRRKWPRWTPPDEMVARQKNLVKYSIANGGMDPGLKNPLGARALYIFQNGQDTLYRLHGNPEWQSIGHAKSSGCVRFLNQDIIDLYDRVPEKARIIVKQ
jgi:lipoprotein-anchoring transpeptidase ErfK/SrfK